MSWSAPSSGGAPAYQAAPAFAQQPYPQQQAYGQPPYAQPPYQQSAPPSSQSSSAPTTYPPKRKGNPVITRYPPPPGYRPPPPPSGQPPYGQGQYSQPNYQQQPQGYPPQSYPQGYSGYQQLSQGYQPSWQPPPGYPPPQSYQQQGYQQPPPPPPPDASSAPTAYPSNGFQQSPTFAPSSQSGSYPPPESAISPTTAAPPLNLGSPPNQNSRPSKSRRNTRTASIVPTEVPESHKLYQSEAYTINLGLDEWDQTDFDGAIWPKANEPVDSNFSLGVIIWHPANETTRALSSDFVSAEERAAKPPLPKIGNGDSVSEYFGPENAHEAFLNVRQTDEWDSIRHDSIFYEFPKTSDIVALEDVLANRDRPNPEGENPYPNIHELQERNQRQGAGWNVMDNLEQALSSEQAEDGGSRKQSHVDQSTPPPPPASRDDAQEALLASLGVTGSPKPVTQMPTPTFLPPKPPKPSARKGSDHDRPYEEHLPKRPSTDNNGYSSHGPLPPQQNQQSPSFEPWRADNTSAKNGDRRQSPARSENSQHTATGSDFHMEDNDTSTTNAPALQRPPRPARADSSAGRKRSYEETESPQRQADDTPRFKRRQPVVAAAYGRR